MADMSFSFSGGAEIEAALKNFPANLQREVGIRSIKEAVAPIAMEAQRLAPANTGRLARAIAIATSANSRGIISVDVGVIRGTSRGDNKGAWYAHFVEFGTKVKGARPFLRPAFDNKSAEAVANIGAALKKYTDRLIVSGRGR